MPGTIVMSRVPNTDDGPQRFIRRWLQFDEHRPVRLKTMWLLIAAVLSLLMMSALLAWRNTIDVPTAWHHPATIFESLMRASIVIISVRLKVVCAV